MYRKQLLPISSTIQRVVEEMPRFNAPLATSLSRFFYTHMGVDIPADVWSDIDLPDHLKMRIAVMDSKNSVIAAGRDIDRLKQKRVIAPSSHELAAERKKWEKKGILQWDFGDLPDTLSVSAKDHVGWVLYPALKMDHQALCLHLFHDQTESLSAHKKGVAYLAEIYLSKELRFLKKNLRLARGLENIAGDFGGSASLERQIYARVTQPLLQRNIRRQSQFYSWLGRLSKEPIHTWGQDLLDTVTQVLDIVAKTRATFKQLEMANLNNQILLQFLASLDNNLTRLVPQNFIALYDNDRLRQIIRYVKGMQIRAQRGVVNFEKDLAREKIIAGFDTELSLRLKELSPSASNEKRAAIETFFWLLEEFKISLFAQELKTAFPVSEKKLTSALQHIDRMV